MKIAIDISQVAYYGTGVASYTENLVKSIAKIDKNNKYVLFGSSLRNTKIIRDFCQEFNKYPNFSYKIFKFPPSFLNVLWNKLHVLPIEKLIGKVDVVHTSDWLEPPSKAQKVTTIHDLVVFTHPVSVVKSIVNTQKQKLRWVKSESAKVIAVSESTKKDIINYLEIPAERIKVIYEASGDNFKKTSEKNSKYNLPENYFLVVGASQERKNLKRIISAFKSLSLKDFKLVIVGKISEDLNTDQDIVTFGFIPEADLPIFYSYAKALIFVPTYEGFGLPVLEALKCGCQVVTSNVSSLPEVGGEAVFYCDPESQGDIADKIKLSLVSPKKGLEMQANKFSWEKAALETVKLYESLS